MPSPHPLIIGVAGTDPFLAGGKGGRLAARVVTARAWRGISQRDLVLLG